MDNISSLPFMDALWRLALKIRFGVEERSILDRTQDRFMSMKTSEVAYKKCQRLERRK